MEKMATTDIRYSCGCGFRTDKVEEAVKHSDERKHTLTVLGTIQPETK